MFGKQKPKQHTALAAKDTSAVTHQFDQTNGVMKAYDDYLAKRATRGG